MRVNFGGRDEMGILVELHPEEGEGLNAINKAGYILNRNDVVIAAHWRVERTYIVARVSDPLWRMSPEQALAIVIRIFARSDLPLNYE